MSNEEFVKKVSDHLHYFFIGVESFSNRQLKIINKGYSADRIWKMKDNLVKYVDRETPINNFMIMDLPSYDINEIKENYEKAIEFKQQMHKEGFKYIRFTYQLLGLNRATELNEGLIFDENIPSGQHRILSEMKNAEFFKQYDDKLINEIYKPFHRNLPSDVDIVKTEDMKYLTSWEKC